MWGEISVLTIIGSAVLFALLGGNLINRFRIPMVTGYVIMGVLLGKSFFNLISPQAVERVSILNDLALGIISFLIGGELHITRLRRLGKSILCIALLESFFAFLLVTIFMMFMKEKIYTALILGAVASATAPAATVAVINQYRARGPLTTTILGVVGSDDAIALIIYGFAASLAKVFLAGIPLSFSSAFLVPLKEIMGSIVLGLGGGVILGFFFTRVRERTQNFTLLVGMILLVEGLAHQFHLSELLSIMVMAFVGSNLGHTRRFVQCMDTLNLAGFPIIAAFFFLAGTKLEVSLLPTIGWLGLVYTGARMLGKVGGASLGAKMAKAPPVVRKYVGFSLWPQIGVAIALAVVVEKDFSSFGVAGENLAKLVINILLFTTVITEIVGPIMTRKSLYKAGEIREGV